MCNKLFICVKAECYSVVDTLFQFAYIYCVMFFLICCFLCWQYCLLDFRPWLVTVIRLYMPKVTSLVVPEKYAFAKLP